jgi:hypothetical protein
MDNGGSESTIFTVFRADAADPGDEASGIELRLVWWWDRERIVEWMRDGIPGLETPRDPGHPPLGIHRTGYGAK